MSGEGQIWIRNLLEEDRGDKVKIIEERPADSQGFPGAKWLKFERPIGGHPDSWVLSRNTERH